MNEHIEKSEGQLNFEEVWDGKCKPNNSPKCKKLYKEIEKLGHTNIYVWYERLGSAVEMCGMSGGYMFASDQEELYPLGISFEEAMDTVKNHIEHVDDV